MEIYCTDAKPEIIHHPPINTLIISEQSITSLDKY